MGFLRAVIDYEDKNYIATLYYSWMYMGESTKIKKFKHLQDAKEWILHERCYNELKITDEAHNALSYSDALKLQLKSKRYKH
jgi:hypothetical protein